MKIASKIDKRTHTRLSKTNAKYLIQEIENALHDLKIEAEILIDDWNPENKFMDEMSKRHIDTINSYQKEIKLAFREFKRDKIKLNNALLKAMKQEIR